MRPEQERRLVSIGGLAMAVVGLALALFITAPLMWRRADTPQRMASLQGTPPELPEAPERRAPEHTTREQSRGVDPRACTDLVRFETAALAGALTDDAMICLEAAFVESARQADRKKVSLLLIANASGRRDRTDWGWLVRRHLEEVDSSDPDIAFAFAQFLARQGPGPAEQVIHWSEVALENRARWTGETRSTRVHNLYKLRAAAAHTVWVSAESDLAEGLPGMDELSTQRAHDRLAEYAKDWLRVAHELDKDTAIPLQLCRSATGNPEWCEAS